MKKIIFLFGLITMLFMNDVLSTKLVEVRVVDKDYIIVYFMDGEVVFRDNAVGKSAYTGHDWDEGDDKMISYGAELDVSFAADLKSWRLTSNEDINYKGKGEFPIASHRKSKVNNTTHDWDYSLDHWIFLKMPISLQQGSSYSLEIGKETNSDKLKVDFTFDLTTGLSEAIHVNMIGYTPQSPIKSADLYLWMGDGGERDYNSFIGNDVLIYNVDTKEQHVVSTVSFWKELNDAEAEKRNLTGSSVWNIDFTGFNEPGRYRLLVEGVGCSQDFEIKRNLYYEPYSYSVRGYYYMRIGEDRMDMVPVPRRPLFIPGKDPEGFTIFLTDLQPYHPVWKEIRGDVWDEPHFRLAAESKFWQHRLPGNPTNPNAVGGHSDALDWDRHLGHVSNIYDLLLPYLLSQGELNDDDLNIGESGNGIPDLIDEARNEVDFWLSLRNGDAYAHGLTNPTKERTMMFQAGTTTMAAWANAANCAMIADCFRLSGNKELEKYYSDEAIKAFRFAENEKEQMLDMKQGIGDGIMRGRDFKMMAAAFLYNVSGETEWEDIMAEESVARDGVSNVEDRKSGVQVWATAAYLFSPQNHNYPKLFKNMKMSIRSRAMEHNVSQMDLRPSRRSSNDNYWQTAQNMNMVILAHALAENNEKRELYEKSMVLEADWGLGRNPTNTVEMTGLGERHIVNCYTSGRNDGTVGLHPGQTPYNNLDPWGRGNIHNGSNPQWFVEKCYPEWKSGGWPHQEGFFNSRYCWANGEFTPRQTMRGKMVLLGYLHYIYNKD